jgi:hypothetical protein
LGEGLGRGKKKRGKMDSSEKGNGGMRWIIKETKKGLKINP